MRITLVGDSQLTHPRIKEVLEQHGHQVTNLSISGQTQTLRKVSAEQVASTWPDVVVLWLGVNDWYWLAADPWTYALIYREFVLQLKCPVLCVDPIRNKVEDGEQPERRKPLNLYRWWVKAVADKIPHATHVHGGGFDIRAHMYDKLHPNEQGAELVARFLQDHISTVPP